MACANCGSGGGCSTGGGGCSSGKCSSNSCNRLNVYDWLTDVADPGQAEYETVEVTFKQGSRKGFYRKPSNVQAITGDPVAVEATGGGYDIGHISLSGELVRLQMKRKRVRDNQQMPSVLRIANERDMERLKEARAGEQAVLVKSRAIARSLNLDMKIGDVEFQGDMRKVTIYYTADGRIDFRELIKHYARDFKVRIEMRQIGARQESARIGGLGPCGRELCCSTWLSDFKSVSTSAARYQNLAINQAKLSGQCGRLKCCLNYELDAYIEVYKQFPRNADKLHTETGTADLIKTDIFKRLMFYIYKEQSFSKMVAISIERAKEIKAMNQKGIKPAELQDQAIIDKQIADNKAEMGFVDVTGEIELKPLQKKKKKKKRPGGDNTNSDRPASADRPARVQGPPRDERQNRPERNDRPPRQERTDRPERNDRPPRTERTDNPPRTERTDRPQRNDRPPRTERTDNPPRQERTDRPERNDRPPRTERTDNPPRQDNRPKGPRPPQQQGPKPEGQNDPNNQGPANPDGQDNPNRNSKNKRWPRRNNKPNDRKDPPQA